MQKLQPKDIDETIIYAIYSLSRNARKHMRLDHDENELSPLQLNTLIAIARGTNTMKGLADEMGITMPSATSLVDRMVKTEYIERAFDPTDRRLVLLRVTDAGSKVMISSIEEKMKKMQLFLDALDQHDKEELLRIITKVTANLEQKKI